MKSAFELSGVEVVGPEGRIVGGLDWVVADQAVTALLGPAGGGKSTILKAMSGRPAPAGWKLNGRWTHRDQDLSEMWAASAPSQDIAWVPQIRHAPAAAFSDPSRRSKVMSRIESAFYSSARSVLLDEPSRGLGPEETEDLAHLIERHRSSRAIVLVTHDLSLVRRLADDLCVICAGEPIAIGRARDMMERPPSDLAKRFFETGYTWPPAREPELPKHFRWILDRELAGMGRPGLTAELDDDLFSIANAGISLLVCLTHNPIPSTRLRPFGIASRHLPIKDMGVPSVSDVLKLCGDIDRSLAAGTRVAVHCEAGLGRTGTILASFLVHRGQHPDAAVAAIRERSSGYIQTEGQLRFVHEVYEACRPSEDLA